MDILKGINEVKTARHSSKGQSVALSPHCRAFIRKYIEPPNSMARRNTPALAMEWSERSQVVTVAAVTPIPKANAVIFDGMAPTSIS